MTEYIPIILCITGFVIGVVTFYLGYREGFKASYEIRSVLGGDVDEDYKLFKQKKDPAEFAVLDKQDELDKQDNKDSWQPSVFG